jgi:hypothetical protein
MGISFVVMTAIILVPWLISTPPLRLIVLRDDHYYLQPDGVTLRASPLLAYHKPHYSRKIPKECCLK